MRQRVCYKCSFSKAELIETKLSETKSVVQMHLFEGRDLSETKSVLRCFFLILDIHSPLLSDCSLLYAPNASEHTSAVLFLMVSNLGFFLVIEIQSSSFNVLRGCKLHCTRLAKPSYLRSPQLHSPSQTRTKVSAVIRAPHRSRIHAHAHPHSHVTPRRTPFSDHRC